MPEIPTLSEVCLAKYDNTVSAIFRTPVFEIKKGAEMLDIVAHSEGSSILQQMLWTPSKLALIDQEDDSRVVVHKRTGNGFKIDELEDGFRFYLGLGDIIHKYDAGNNFIGRIMVGRPSPHYRLFSE